MDTRLLSLPATASSNVDMLSEIAKITIERVDLWFSWMLAIATILLTAITVLIALIAFLTWKHVKQAGQASKLLNQAKKTQKEAEERAQFIAKMASEDKAKLKLKGKAKGLSPREIVLRARSHRGYAPVLFQANGQAEVYAIDEYGYKHWIPNPPTLTRMGYSWSDVKHITKQELDLIPTGENIPDLS